MLCDSVCLKREREEKQLSLTCPACCSGFAVGIYTTNSPEACQYVAENCKANIIVVENHKQLQKILQVRSQGHAAPLFFLLHFSIWDIVIIETGSLLVRHGCTI